MLQRMSAGVRDARLALRVVKALAVLLDSPAGALWYVEESSLALATTWNLPVFSLAGSDAAALADFFHAHEEVVDLRNGSPATEPTTAAPLSAARSEEHPSELQSLMRISYAVFCLKKKKNTTQQT